MAERNPETEVIKANNQFTIEMYKILSKTQGNILFSPLSAHACLSMVYQAAVDTTKTAFARALHISDPILAVEGHYSIITILNTAENIALSIANKLYVKTDYHIKSNFENVITKKFLSEVETVNFEDNKQTAELVNAWVSKKTEGNIQAIVKDTDFASTTRLFLVSAVYFKGEWQKPFSCQTQIKPFYIDDSNTVEANMMSVKYFFAYKEDDELKSQVLEIPYENRKFSMVIILPNEKNGITELESKLLEYDLAAITESMGSASVQVYLPKFKAQIEIDLELVLKNMGLEELFTRDCKIPNMIEEHEVIFVDKALQRAFIEVNEQGTEAAAVTGIRIREPKKKIMYNNLKIFNADHPFIFMIMSKQICGNSILFYGGIHNPNETVN